MGSLFAPTAELFRSVYSRLIEELSQELGAESPEAGELLGGLSRVISDLELLDRLSGAACDQQPQVYAALERSLGG
jgi:hypothetical protein